jgi:hypothetical protein
MPAQTIAAEVDSMDPAMDDWYFHAAKIAATFHAFRLSFDHCCGRAGLQRTRLHVNTTGDRESAEGKYCNAASEHARIGISAESRGQKAQAKQHEETSGENRHATCLAHWESLSLREKAYAATIVDSALQIPDDEGNRLAA